MGPPLSAFIAHQSGHTLFHKNQWQKYNAAGYGPTFGGGHDIYIDSTLAAGYVSAYSYCASSFPQGQFNICSGSPHQNILSRPGATTVSYSSIEVFEVLDGVLQSTSTTITSDLPDPSLIGASVPINVSVPGVTTQPGGGSVTVTATTGETCIDPTPDAGSGTTALFSCTMTFNTAGLRDLTATYSGSTTHLGSASAIEAHSVVGEPTFIINDVNQAEGDSGPTNFQFTITRSHTLSTVNVDAATADISATAGSDYTALATQTITFTAGGSATATVNVVVTGDTEFEDNESFALDLTNPVGATISDGQGIGTVANDDAPSFVTLNDTGQISCYNNDVLTGTVAPGTPDPETAGFNEQDCTQGRAAADAVGVLPKLGDSSVAGRDYTKIANNGSELPASATLGSGPTDWACTRDNVTGLIWEVKVDDAAHLRHYGHTYTWYETDATMNGGNSGTASGAGCNATLAQCNTTTFRDAVNTGGLCGSSDWRLPTAVELQSLVSYGGTSLPLIDAVWLPNTSNAAYWTAQNYAQNPSLSWVVVLDALNLDAYAKSGSWLVRLVRTEP